MPAPYRLLPAGCSVWSGAATCTKSASVEFSSRKAPRGTLVSNGTSSGPVVIDTTLLAVKGSIWLTRPAMVHYATPRSHMLAMADELFGHVLAGRIRGEPNQIFPLAEAAEAHRALESRRTVGATVLVP